MYKQCIYIVTMALLAAFILSCQPEVKKEAEKPIPPQPELGLVKINTPDAYCSDSGVIENFGIGEKYLLYPYKINFTESNAETVSIQARVKFLSAAGYNGLGFISMGNTANRKGYMLLTAQDIRNEGMGSGITNPQFMNPQINWEAGQEYIFKSEITNQRISFYVYDADGLSQLSALQNRPLGYTKNDLVYPAIGGSNVENMEWSDIIITVSSSYTENVFIINHLRPQSVIPVLELDETNLHVLENEQCSVAYTATAEGGETADIIAVSDNPDIVSVDSFNDGIIKLSGLSSGKNSVISVTNTAEPLLIERITVNVDFPLPENDNYGVFTSFPAAGSTDAPVDGELMISFDDVPILNRNVGRAVYIFNKETNEKIDTIFLIGERQITLGNSNNNLAVDSQLVRVEGNSVFITPHFNRLEYGKQYYIAISNGAVSAYSSNYAKLNGKDFIGFGKQGNWSFTTRSAPVLNEDTPISVNADYTIKADFRTVYGALDAIAGKTGNWTINVAPGIYIELVHYVAAVSGQTITINGTGTEKFGKDVVIQYTNNEYMNGGSGGTMRRPSFYFNGANLILKNVTLKNTSSRSAGTDPGQAEALYFDGNNRTMAAYNCSFLSHQDTIQTKGKNWFYKCYIEGDTDYIWGQADAALFEECELVSINDSNKTNKDAILLVARTMNNAKDGPTVPKGYVIFNSKVTTRNGMTTYFARNAGGSTFYDQCAVINTAFINEGTGKIADSIWMASNYSSGTRIDNKTEHVGWKLYNNTVNGAALDTSAMLANTSTIPKALYDSEYTDRHSILNRQYQKSDDTYIVAEPIWDMGSLETSFNAGPDASK